ncbi:MAG: SH3 domain-containing protein [Chloroflexota bacterium]
MHRRSIVVMLLLLFGLTALVSAQEGIRPGDETEINADANISWPPPVYVLRGEVDIRGTANLQNLNNYFLEFRPLESTGEMGEEDSGEPTPEPQELPWFPVTLPSSSTVVEGVLGTWDTETTADGLYELRLTINVSGQPSFHFVVSPLRVENEPPEFVVEEGLVQPPSQVTATPSGRPTLAASPTPLDSEPRVTANLSANVRAGDSTNYEIIGALRTNQTADVVGISNTGNGWYLIRLPDGDEGWIAPSVVTPSGDFGDVPRVAPPPPPATNTPVPPTRPPASGNLAGSSPSLTPSTPTCNVAFQVLVNITNTGSAPTTGPATILFQDIHVDSGTVTTSFTRAVPVLAPGENFVVGSDSVTVSTFFNEQHRLVVTIDPENNVFETDENDNVLTTTYTLQQGGC